jgi:small subunit ribosomal protein S3Ae
MAKAKTKVSKIKVKKKKWFKIVSPKIFGKKEIGEIYLSTVESAIGRKLKINLKDLTGSVKDQNVFINLQINNSSGSTLETKTVGYEMSPSYVKRIIKKRTSKLDDYFKLTNKNGKEVIVKSLIITLGKAPRSTRAEINKETGKELEARLKKITFENFITELVNKKIQLNLKKKLNKIYPLKEVAVRVTKLNDKSLELEETEKNEEKEE